MLSVGCPVCLSVTLVHCGQTVGRIKMKLGMQIGLGPDHIVLDGDPAPLPKGAQIPTFGPYQLWPNGCMDQDVTWYGARPRPRRLCVRWGPSPPSSKGAALPSPIFVPFLLWPNGWIHQDATWYGCRPLPRGLCVRWRPSPLPKKGVEPPLRNFRPMFIVAKRLDGLRCQLA